jgi:hypothetical protein
MNLYRLFLFNSFLPLFTSIPPMKRKSTILIAALVSAFMGTAHAQIAVDGTLNTSEIGTGLGKYQLMSTYTGAHSVAGNGLAALYVAADATNLYVFVVASPEQPPSSYSAVLVYVDAPHATGVPAGTQLGGGDDGQSQLRAKPTLDQETDFAYRTTVAPVGTPNAYYSRLDYTGAPNSSGQYKDTYLGTTDKSGTVLNITDAATNTVDANFAYLAGATDVANNTNTGFEFSVPLSTIGGAATGDVFNFTIAYVGDNADFTSDVIPQIANQTTALGPDPDLHALPGVHHLGYKVGSGPTATKVRFTPTSKVHVSGNPISASSTLDFSVPEGTRVLMADAYNLLGEKVATITNQTYPAAGTSRASLSDLANLPAGTYVVVTTIGDQQHTSRVVVK